MEDCEINYKLAEYILSRSSYSVERAVNGQVAIEKIWAEHSYDVVLMDVHMPEIDGIKATQIIRQFQTKEDLPIIGVTADNAEEQLMRLSEAGMNGHLLKPYARESLLKTVQETIKGTPHRADKKRVCREWNNTQSDTELLRKTLPLLQKSTQTILHDIIKALEQKNNVKLRELHHQLKGTLGNFTTTGPFERVLHCESLLVQKDYQSLTSLMPILNLEIQELQDCIALHIQNLP